jgi:hypothetical protein
LVKNEFNVEIKPYEFQGPDYWFNMFLNYGHVLIIYLLMGKYKTETDEPLKKKIMFAGIAFVAAWFLLTPMIKPQKIAI